MIANRIGDGHLQLVKSLTNDELKVINFEFFYRGDELGTFVYIVEDCKMIRQSEGVTRMVIRSIRMATHKKEFNHYQQMALKYGVESVSVQLAFTLYGSSTLLVPGRVLY